MSDAIRYRGRDGEGEWSSEGVCLLHARLSIVDISGGAQPMTDASGRYVIVFNGEIYNYRELRREYEALGARYKTQSDTEVILEGFRLKGADVCRDLNGMFAFAIWDNVEQRLFLARDRLGKKPLYWTVLDSKFFFASSLNAFRKLPGWKGTLSRVDLDVYAAIGDFRPGRTAFRMGRSIPPASWAFVDPKNSLLPRETTYWSMDFSKPFKGNFEDALEAFEALIADAIKIRLRADVPIALTFSGGVDSGIIAAVTAKRLNYPLSCWTIDYHTDADPSEETIIAQRVAQDFGLQWNYSHFDYHNDLISSLRETLRNIDQPCRHMAIGYSDRLYSAMRREATVVLSGNGADELFLGYSGNEALVSQESARRRSFVEWFASLGPGRGGRSRALANYQAEYVRANIGRYADEDDPESFISELQEDILQSGAKNFGELYTFMATRYYTSDPNYRIPDVTGLANQVEVRSPFLDYRIVEFANSLPIEFKIGDVKNSKFNKKILKEYYGKYVSSDVAWAAKKGMGHNLRYGQSLAEDQSLVRLYERLLGVIGDAGLPAERYRFAWENFRRDKLIGLAHSASAGAMSSGLMLGLWLDVQNGR